MQKSERFIVFAAEYTDMTFQTPIEATIEVVGPFDSYSEAYAAWHGVAYKWIDVCTHKASIEQI